MSSLFLDSRVLSDSLHVKGVKMLHFLPLFVLLLQQHIITVIKSQQHKYEKVVVQWNADYKSFSSVIKTPDEWQRQSG